MKHIAVIAAAAFMALMAPMASATPWTLDECIEYAVAHNLTVKARQYDVESGNIDLNSAKNRFLPTVEANASQHFSFGRSVAEDNIKVSSNSSSFSWGANANLPLFDGLKNVRQLKGARLNLTDLLLRSDAARDDISLNVIAAYLQALLNDELVKVAETQVELSKIEVTRQTDLVEAGKSPELDLIQARSQLAQDEVTLVNSRNDFDLAMLDLKQLLMLPDDEPMEITPLDGTDFLIPDAEEVYRSAMDHNSSILSKRQGIRIADNNISIAQSGYLPTLSFGASIGSSYTHMKGIGVRSFGEQMRDNMQEMLGFTLSVPLFDAFSTRNSVRTARVRRLMADLELEEESTRLYKTITQAYYQADAARKKADASAIAESATKAALEAMTTKFNYGKATATEYEQAKADYIRARSTTIQARYEYIVRAKILDFYNRPHTYSDTAGR